MNQTKNIVFGALLILSSGAFAKDIIVCAASDSEINTIIDKYRASSKNEVTIRDIGVGAAGTGGASPARNIICATIVVSDR